MTFPRFFLDTNVLVSGTALPALVPPAARILESDLCEKFTNEYALKEMRRVLGERFGIPPRTVDETLDFIRRKVNVVPTPHVNSFSKFDVVDRSDRPIACSAAQLSAILVTEDRLLRREAARYVLVVSSSEAWKRCKEAGQKKDKDLPIPDEPVK